MQYTSEIWIQNRETAEFEKIHLSYLKNMMKVKPFSSTHAIYSEFGRFPLKIQQKCHVIQILEEVNMYESK